MDRWSTSGIPVLSLSTTIETASGVDRVRQGSKLNSFLLLERGWSVQVAPQQFVCYPHLRQGLSWIQLEGLKQGCATSRQPRRPLRSHCIVMNTGRGSAQRRLIQRSTSTPKAGIHATRASSRQATRGGHFIWWSRMMGLRCHSGLRRAMYVR
jgi:hypothetical protein